MPRVEAAGIASEPGTSHQDHRTMTTPPTDPRPATGGTARLKARAAKGSALRPEVMNALDQLEASLGGVAQWEQILSGQVDVAKVVDATVVDEAPEAPPAPYFGTGSLLTRDTPTEDRDVRPPPPVPGTAQAAAAPLLVEFVADPSDLPQAPGSDASLLWQARTVAPTVPATGSTGGDPPAGGDDSDAEDLARRRQAGRALSWVGVILIVLAAGYFGLVRDTDPDTRVDQLPAQDQVVTTRRTPTSLGPASSLGTVQTTVVTVPSTVAGTTATTRKAAVTPKPTTKPTSATTATTAPATTTPVPDPIRPAPTCGLFNCPSTTVKPTTTTTTTTQPPTDGIL
jgi:hypothetical protein